MEPSTKRFTLLAEGSSDESLIPILLWLWRQHRPKDELVEPQFVDTFKTGAQYQFYHALAIGFATIISQFIDNQWIKRVNWSFLLGIILFSGSLYILTLGKVLNTEGVNWVGVITPLGGLFFLVGWLSLAWGIHKS